MPPLVRARHPQTLLALVAERYPDVHAKAKATMRCAEALTHALPIEWLPVEVDVEVMETLTRALPRPAMDTLIADRQRKEMGSVLYKSFVATMTKLFGLTPATFIRHLDRGWSQILTDCGVIEVLSLETRSGMVAIRQLPPSCLASDAWIDALPPGMRILYELVGTRGEVTVLRKGDEVHLRYDW